MEKFRKDRKMERERGELRNGPTSPFWKRFATPWSEDAAAAAAAGVMTSSSFIIVQAMTPNDRPGSSLYPNHAWVQYKVGSPCRHSPVGLKTTNVALRYDWFPNNYNLFFYQTLHIGVVACIWAMTRFGNEKTMRRRSPGFQYGLSSVFFYSARSC